MARRAEDVTCPGRQDPRLRGRDRPRVLRDPRRRRPGSAARAARSPPSAPAPRSASWPCSRRRPATPPSPPTPTWSSSCSASASSPASSTRCPASRANCSPAWRSASATPTPAQSSSPPARNLRHCRHVLVVLSVTQVRRGGVRPACRFRRDATSRSLHHVVLAIGVVLFVFVIASGVMPAITQLARPLARPARGVRRRADTPSRSRSTARSRPCCCSSPGSRRCACRNYERGQPDNRRTNREERRSSASRASAPACGCRRCCAIPPPASCTRSSTSGSCGCSS